MSAISNYLEDAWLKTLRGGGNGTTFTAPAAIYVQLHTADPTDAGTTSVSSTTTRQAVTFAAPSGTNTDMASNADVSWTNWAGTNGEVVSHISLWDASSSGNCLWRGALTASKTVNTGDTLTIPSGSLTLTLQ